MRIIPKHSILSAMIRQITLGVDMRYILGTFLLTSLSAKTRMYGFVVFLLVNIPGIYLLIVTELWWILAVTPLWLYLNYRGFINNYREHKGDIPGST